MVEATQAYSHSAVASLLQDPRKHDPSGDGPGAAERNQSIH
jgi:hypothetical protein